MVYVVLCRAVSSLVLKQRPCYLQLSYNFLQHLLLALISPQLCSSSQLPPTAAVVALGQQHSRQLAPHLQGVNHAPQT